MKTLEQCLQFFGERPASASRRLSKKFEETVKGIFDRSDHALQRAPSQGRFVLVIGGKEAEKVKNVRTIQHPRSGFLPEAPLLQLLLLHASTA